MPIDPLPTPPSRDDAANFAARADTFLAALVPFQAQANALEANVNLQAASTQAAVSSFASLLASTGLSQFGDPPTSLTLTQSTDSVVGSILYLRSSRGSAASRADSTTGDYAGEIRFEAMQGGNFFVAGLLRSFFIDDAGGFAGGLRFYTPRKGATTNTEVLRLEADTGLSMYGANPVIDQNRGLRLRSFTVATLPGREPLSVLDVLGERRRRHLWRRRAGRLRWVELDAARPELFSLLGLRCGREYHAAGELPALPDDHPPELGADRRSHDDAADAEHRAG